MRMTSHSPQPLTDQGGKVMTAERGVAGRIAERWKELSFRSEAISAAWLGLRAALIRDGFRGSGVRH